MAHRGSCIRPKASRSAVLNCAGEVPLASELFSYGFYQSIDEGCEPKLLRQLDESPSEWLDELQCRFISHCFNGTDKRKMASFVAETFHNAVARRGCFVWWSVPCCGHQSFRRTTAPIGSAGTGKYGP